MLCDDDDDDDDNILSSNLLNTVRYIDNLVGPYPEAKSTFEERSAMRHVKNISCPILLLQGTLILMKMKKGFYCRC